MVVANQRDDLSAHLVLFGRPIRGKGERLVDFDPCLALEVLDAGLKLFEFVIRRQAVREEAANHDEENVFHGDFGVIRGG